MQRKGASLARGPTPLYSPGPFLALRERGQCVSGVFACLVFQKRPLRLEGNLPPRDGPR